MWLQENSWDRKDGMNGIVAVAIDKDKGAQHALKWAIDHLLKGGATLVLIHVHVKQPSLSSLPSLTTPRAKGIGISEQSSLVCKDPDDQIKDIFRPYRLFCVRKDIHCKDVVLEDGDISGALIEYTSHSAIEHLVIGSSSKSGFLRFKVADIPGTISKGAPDFCTVYVVSKGKVQSMRSASRLAPFMSPLQSQLSQTSVKSDQSDPLCVPLSGGSVKGERRSQEAPAHISIDALPRRSHYRITNYFRCPKMSKILVILYFNGKIYEGSQGVVFDGEKKSLQIQQGVTYDILKKMVHNRLKLEQNQYIVKLTVKLLERENPPKYMSYVLHDDEDIDCIFYSFMDSSMRVLDIYAEKDVASSSSTPVETGGANMEMENVIVDDC